MKKQVEQILPYHLHLTPPPQSGGGNSRQFRRASPKAGRGKLLMLLLALCFFSPIVSATLAEDSALFQQANKNYRDGHFKEAADVYETLAKKYPDQASFFYNLGNSYFRLKERAEAILAYERAKKHAPRNADIRYNLNYLQGLSEYKVEDKRNWYLRAAEQVLGYFTEKEITVLSLASYFLLMASWAFVLFFRPGTPWGWMRKTFLFISILTFALMGVKSVQAFWIRDAIVMSEGAQVRYGPSETDQIAFRLGEGLKIYVVDSREGWSRVLIPNGDSGWIDSSQIAEVRL